MTKFTSLAIFIIMVVSLTASLPAQADDNPVNLELGGEGAIPWNIANILPGDSGIKTVTLHNAGDVDGFVTIWISDNVSSEGINPESETGDTLGPGELDHYLLLNVSCDGLDSNISLPTTIDNLPHSAFDPNYIKISPLNVGNTITLNWQWQLPVEADNEAQGDSLSFTVNYMLEEFPPPPLGGGGIGAPGYYLLVNLWGEKSWTPVTSAGRVISELEAISVDELVTFSIDKGVRALTKDRRRLREIEVWPMTEPPPLPENCYLIGSAYDIVPRGSIFAPPVGLLIDYDPEELPENVSSVFIVYYDDEQGWIPLEPISGLVAEVGTATAQVSHFTVFAILGCLAPVLPANFNVSSLSIQPSESYVPGIVNVSVMVANTGGEAGSYEVAIKINGVIEATREVIVQAGSSKEVTFTVFKDIAGSYSVEVNGLSGSFTMVERPPVYPTTVPPTAPPAKPLNWYLIGGVIAGVVVALVTSFLVGRRARRN